MKNKLLKTLPVITIAAAGVSILPMTSCNKSKDLYTRLTKLDGVVKVEKLQDMTQFKERYMVWFKQPLDWNDKSKGYFNQRVEVNYNGDDCVTQLFTCGYELRNFSRQNDFEIAKRYEGNVIKPEYRFFDESRPEGLDCTKLSMWEYLNNTNGAADFHRIITSLKKILKGKWAFTGTSKGGETTNVFAMLYPNDCDAYVPYVAPRFYKRNNDTFMYNVYNTIGNDILTKDVADSYRKEVSKMQYYLFKNKHEKLEGEDLDLVETFWNGGFSYTFSKYAKAHHDYMYDLCVEELATSFWQYDQNIEKLKAINDMEESNLKLQSAFNLLKELNGLEGYALDHISAPYHIQACREMGEYNYDFSFMIEAMKTNLGLTETEINAVISVPTSERKDFYWKITLEDCQYEAWYVNQEQDMTLANKLIEWNQTCKVPVFMVYGGADTWYSVRLDETQKSDSIQVYVGKDPNNPHGRTHRTRITTLLPNEQNKIWEELDKIFK